MTSPEWGNLYNLMKQITSTMISSTIYYKPYYFHAGFCGKKKREKTLLLSLSSSYLPFSFKITQKCNSLCFLSSGFNFPQDKRKKPTNLRLNLFAQSWISLINKVEENRSIAVPERVFTFAGVLTCANSCLLRTWNDFKEWTSIPSVCPF